MTYVLTADEGKWITEIGFTPEKEDAPNFWKEVRTSVPHMFDEVIEEVKQERIAAWKEAHEQPEPNEGQEV